VNPDVSLLIGTRALRMFAYGFLSVILALHLTDLGLSEAQIGITFTVALAGGTLITMVVSLFADHWGRRRALILFGALMAISGVALATVRSFWGLLVVAALGTISPSGYEIGPFQSLEQAALSSAGGPVRVRLFSWYNLAGSLAVALGGLVVGILPRLLVIAGSAHSPQQVLVWAFTAVAIVLALVYRLLSPDVEASGAAPAAPASLGLRESRGAILRLSALFGVDALAGGLILQSLVAYWFTQRFGVPLEHLGLVFFGTNLLSAISFLVAAPLAERFGLLNTMVFTHLPSNLLLIVVAFMPTWPLAVGALLLRHALSQMDVPTRQAYTMVLVTPEERAAAAGMTNAVRTGAAAFSPTISGIAFQTAQLGLPFILSGALKSIYDVTLWLMFRAVPLREAATRLGRAGQT
jgi:MFS family permease